MAQPGSPLFLPAPGPLPVVGPLFEPEFILEPYSAAVMADAPVGYWRLGEPSGTTARDFSGAGHPGTYTNSPTLGVAGAITGDTAVTFTAASSQYIAPSFVFNQPQATIEAWIYMTAAPSVARLIGGCSDGFNSGTGDKQLYIDTDGKLYFYGFDGAVRITSAPASAIPFNDWVHVAGVADGSNLTTYVNGVSVGSVACGNTFTGYSVNNFFIAALAPTPAGVAPSYFDGSIDEVALYPTGLSAARILAHYNARTSAASGPLTVDASGGTATATGGTYSLAFTWTSASGAATTGGTVSLSEGLTAASGVATATGTTPVVTVTLTAASGAATAGGGTVNKIETATNGLATASGGTDALAFAYTSASGAATASGGTDSFKVTLTAASGTATTGGTVVFKPTYLAASGAATGSGTLPVVTFIYGASSGTATAGGGDATASGGSGVNVSATNGTASATGSAGTLTFVYPSSSGAATAGGTIPAVAFTYGVLSATATADGGAVTLGPPPASGRWDLDYGTHWPGRDGSRWPPGDGSGKWPGSTETRWPATTGTRWN